MTYTGIKIYSACPVTTDTWKAHIGECKLPWKRQTQLDNSYNFIINITKFELYSTSWC